MSKRSITRGAFDYERDGKTFAGTFTVESRYINLWTPHGSTHGAQNIQSVEATLRMLLGIELGGRLIKVIHDSN
jgi:hypothetical protein